METMGLHNVMYCFVLHWPLIMCTNAAFIDVPKDISVGEGEDVEMPCTFKAVSSASTALEIQWWYLREEQAEEPLDELHISTHSRAEIALREAIKISAVRVHGNAISHRLSLSKVKKEDSGVYECRVSGLWFDQSQETMVHATLHVIPVDAMLAEEAVSHIQYRSPLRKTNLTVGGPESGRATWGPGLGQAAGQRPVEAKPGLLPSILSPTTVSVAKSSAASNEAVFYWWHRVDFSMRTTRDQILCFALLILQKFFSVLLVH